MAISLGDCDTKLLEVNLDLWKYWNRNFADLENFISNGILGICPYLNTFEENLTTNIELNNLIYVTTYIYIYMYISYNSRIIIK